MKARKIKETKRNTLNSISLWHDFIVEALHGTFYKRLRSMLRAKHQNRRSRSELM